jgi:riboflavin transporter FmnP
MDSKRIAITAVFAALTVALNPAFSRIAVPAPFFPLISYQIWEIPVVIIFLLVGPKHGVLVALINAAVSLAYSPRYVTIGDLVACLSMLLGGYLAYKLITRKVPQEKTPSTRKLVISYTAGAIIFRTLIMAIQNYTILRYPIIGMNLPESVIITIIPLIALFNITEPLYVIPFGYFMARTINKHLKISNKI